MGVFAEFERAMIRERVKRPLPREGTRQEARPSTAGRCKAAAAIHKLRNQGVASTKSLSSLASVFHRCSELSRGQSGPSSCILLDSLRMLRQKMAR